MKLPNACPKPKPRKKHPPAPLSRSAPPKRSKPPKRRARIKPKKRTPEKFARIYGSKARASWVKSQPCAYCVALLPILALCEGLPRSDNAHTESGHGTAYKADYTTIVPLCRTHHKKYDRRLAPFNDEKIREAVKAMAPEIEARWQAFTGAKT